MGKKGRAKRWQSAEMNNYQYRFYYETLEQLASCIYKWEGLPPEIDERFLNLTLFNRALSVFFYDDEYDAYFATMGAPSGAVNMYQNPLEYIAYGTNGFHRKLKCTECVPIWANYLRRPDCNAMKIYARRLADIDRTIDVNLMTQKMPIFAVVPESQRLTVKNLMKQYSGNEPIIIGSDGMFDPNEISYLNSGAPFITPDLLKTKLTIWSEIMTFFGIDNARVDKAERVQGAEVESNNGQIEVHRLMRLKPLRTACKQINRKYGLELWVDFDHDFSSQNLMTLSLIEPSGESIKTGVEGEEVTL